MHIELQCVKVRNVINLIFAPKLPLKFVSVWWIWTFLDAFEIFQFLIFWEHSTLLEMLSLDSRFSLNDVTVGLSNE